MVRTQSERRPPIDAMKRQTGAHLHFRRRPGIWGHPYGLHKGRRGGISRNLVATPHSRAHRGGCMHDTSGNAGTGSDWLAFWFCWYPLLYTKSVVLARVKNSFAICVTFGCDEKFPYVMKTQLP